MTDLATDTRRKALADMLGVPLEDIHESSWNEKIFVVRPRTVKDGTSPEKAKELATLLRKALGMIITRGEKVAVENVRSHGYKKLEKAMRDRCPPEMFKIGLHDLVNALYFLCPESDGETASNHRDTLREAFDGQEPTDRRTTRETNDGEYLVVTDDEADELWDDALESLLEDSGCVPGADSPYFDRDRWEKDARMDGRGHSLGCYDGCEEETSVHDEETGEEVSLYIYRQN